MSDNDLLQFFVGTISNKVDFTPQANGEGIITCHLNMHTGKIRQTAVCKEVINASYLAKCPDKNVLFAACDHPFIMGDVKALSISKEGVLNLISTKPSEGTITCHITCDQKGERIFVSSYFDGKLSTYKYDGKKLSSAIQVVSYSGHGPNKERQESSHAHQAVISPDGKWLYVCDLGSDTIWCHPLNNLKKRKGIKISPGYGPRHMVFHPNLSVSYIFCELNAHILTMKRDDKTGNLSLLNDQPTLPKSYKGLPSGAAVKLHPSNKTLFVSNRLHDSLTVFSINESDGHLKWAQNISCAGNEPRDFAIDPIGKWLVIANQNSDALIPFELNPKTGLPTGAHGPEFHCGTPVCVVF